MKVYTENEIKEWFSIMKKRYPNSVAFEQLKAVEFRMFNEDFDTNDCLETIKKELTNNP